MLVGNWMSKEPVSVTADMSMMKASKLMIERKVRRLPVVDEAGKVIGIVTRPRPQGGPRRPRPPPWTSTSCTTCSRR